MSKALKDRSPWNKGVSFMPGPSFLIYKIFCPTCIYCRTPIKFGQDTLEHKTPLSRGGTNEYNNLAIACFPCNRKKNAKTFEEFVRILEGS